MRIEGQDRILTICPKCGKEVREDFNFCPYCETPLKPFCPACKRELEADYARCPYCGFRLGSETPAKRLYTKGGRSRLLTFVIILVFVGGIINAVQGASEATFQWANYTYQGPIPVAAQYLALVQVPVGVGVVILGIIQLLLFYGLVYGKAFPRRYLLRVVGITFVLSLVMLSLDEVISGMFSLSSAVLGFDIFFVIWSFFVLAVVWRYVSIQEMKAILRSTAGT